MYLPRRSVVGCRTLERYEMYLPRKFIVPMILYTSAVSVGSAIFMIASALPRSHLIPFL